MAQQSEDTFITLIQENEGIVHKVIGLYADNETDRKDLHQEILLQSWKGFGRFRGEAKFSTWLYKISLNTALTFRKTMDRQSDIKEGMTESESEKTNQEHHELLYSIVKKMDKVDRMLMSLHLDGYGNKEISEITRGHSQIYKDKDAKLNDSKKGHMTAGNGLSTFIAFSLVHKYALPIFLIWLASILFSIFYSATIKK